MDLALLTTAAFLTSGLTAVVGLGGGVVLILLMPGMVPLAAILPIHAVVQFTSNIGRVAFAHQHISWSLIWPVLAGSIVGALVGSQTVGVISLNWLPAVAAVVILAVTWLPIGRLLPGGSSAFFWLGFYQTGLGMLAGATGPLGAAVLSKLSSQREWLVVNTGTYMTINHGVRSVAFGLMGFAFTSWWQTIVLMSAATILGSWLGTKLRQRTPQGNFVLWFRVLITLLAVRMLWLTAQELFLSAG